MTNLKEHAPRFRQLAQIMRLACNVIPPEDMTLEEVRKAVDLVNALAKAFIAGDEATILEVCEKKAATYPVQRMQSGACSRQRIMLHSTLDNCFREAQYVVRECQWALNNDQLTEEDIAWLDAAVAEGRVVQENLNELL
jgi:hypothetical protein